MALTGTTPSVIRQRRLLLLMILHAQQAMATKACLIWGTSKTVQYGVTNWFAFCDVQWPWGDKFWCEEHEWPTPDAAHPGMYSQMIVTEPVPTRPSACNAHSHEEAMKMMHVLASVMRG